MLENKILHVIRHLQVHFACNTTTGKGIKTLTFQSSVVTSLLFSIVLALKCLSTTTFAGPFCMEDFEVPSVMDQILAVESPDLNIKTFQV